MGRNFLRPICTESSIVFLPARRTSRHCNLESSEGAPRCDRFVNAIRRKIAASDAALVELSNIHKSVTGSASRLGSKSPLSSFGDPSASAITPSISGISPNLITMGTVFEGLLGDRLDQRGHSCQQNEALEKEGLPLRVKLSSLVVFGRSRVRPAVSLGPLRRR